MFADFLLQLFKRLTTLPLSYVNWQASPTAINVWASIVLMLSFFFFITLAAL